ncbi:MAG: site-specific integrase [Myxococcota bacterium]|nr:site-specific integrase [Myxococcota bacterium]
MSIRRDKRNGHWLFRKQIRTTDGRCVRIFGVPTTMGLPDTRAGADEAERREVARVLNTGEVKKASPSPRKESPTVREFSKIFIETSRITNKASTIDAKNAVFKCHLLPLIGDLPIDQVTYAVIEDLKLALARKKISRVDPDKLDEARTLSPKTINNCLTCLRRMLVVARKRGLIEHVPDVEWLRAPAPDFDFLDFEEADRLVAAAEGQLRTMILVGLRTGMRHGEILALRWQDVDLVAGRIMVRQNVVRGIVGTPKSGKPREIALGDDVRAALKAHRHLRGPLVFCDMGGKMLTDSESKNPLAHACKRAGLRPIGWHCLRHSFASHLAMRGATLKVIQDLLGHSTIVMTMRYAHLAPEVGRDAVRLLDGGNRGSGMAAEKKTKAN